MGAHRGYLATFIRLINGSEETIGDLAEENIQARIREICYVY